MTDHNTKNSGEGSAVFPSARVGVAGPSLKTVAARSPEMNRRCAIHEGSGHALVGIALLGPSCVAEVSIVPGLGYQGRCIGPEYREPLCLEEAERQTDTFIALAADVRATVPVIGSNRIRDAEFLIRASATCAQLLAGSIAESILWPGEPPLPAQHDEDEARALAKLAVASPDAVDTFLEYCRAEARALIEEYRDVGSAIADGLIEHGTLSCRQVLEIIAAAMTRRALAAERVRRSDWARICANASTFRPDR
jgi:hypothetical protein